MTDSPCKLTKQYVTGFVSNIPSIITNSSVQFGVNPLSKSFHSNLEMRTLSPIRNLGFYFACKFHLNIN